MIIFAHNFVIAVIVYVALAPPAGWHLIELPIGMMVIAFNAVWLSLFLGMVCARFRDIPQIVTSLVQVAFFLTPVLWKADMLGRNIWAAEYNPYFHFLEVVRQPLLGASASMQSWIFVAGMSLCRVHVYAGVFCSIPRARSLLGLDMTFLKADDVVVDFPIYGGHSRSLKTTLMRAATGGTLARGAGERIVVRALDRVSFDFTDGRPGSARRP